VNKVQYLNYNLFQLSQILYPDFGVVDAFISMESESRHNGNPVDTMLALASVDPIPLDMLTQKLFINCIGL
jgi:uncharacterized protein (DUF362 family)